jgi:hypothetical protein
VAVGDYNLFIAASAAYGLTLAVTNMVVQKMQGFIAQANPKNKSLQAMAMPKCL